ncbi:porin family protein [Rufibacter roseus]|uniref:Porin family protein n=1 Tax=Rufibacter roseus TaxID=1567108 RepID=A0ABW2DH40_9BACT|nr:porin family protein [Rufibacter roseus]
MKKLCLLIISTLMFGAATAQERVFNRGVINHSESGEDGPVATRDNNGFGIKAGVLYNNLRGDGTNAFSGLKSATSWHVGAYSQFSLGNFFSVQPEILYSRRQSKADQGDMRFDYLEVPVLAVMNFTDNVSFHVGPQVGVMMSAKQEGREIATSDFNSFDYGGAAGLEARLSIFRLGARYYLSLADLGKFESSADATNRAFNDIKTGNFQLYIGVGF